MDIVIITLYILDHYGTVERNNHRCYGEATKTPERGRWRNLAKMFPGSFCWD